MNKSNCLTAFVLFLSVLMTACSTTKGLSKEERAAKEVEIREAIENRHFVVEVDRAIPMGGRSFPLTSPYSLTINGDEVKSYLPFFGRVYSVPYGGGDGLIFNSTITDFQSTFDKKGDVIVKFKTKSEDDRLQYMLHIHLNSYTSINVTSVNRQSISFIGKTYRAK